MSRVLQFPGGAVDVSRLREMDDGTLMTTIRGRQVPVGTLPPSGLEELDAAIADLRRAVLAAPELTEPHLERFLRAHNRLHTARRRLRSERGLR